MRTDFAELREKFDAGSPAIAAFDRLIDEGLGARFVLKKRLSKVRSVEFQWPHKKRNPFSVHAAANHLLFYLRKPILQQRVDLFVAAEAKFGPVEPNSLGEYRTRLRTVTDVEVMLSFLRQYSVWPESTRSTNSSITEDIEAIRNDPDISSTTKQALVEARLGQGKFRNDLMERWDSICAVTGFSHPAALKASHMVAWRNSDNQERLDADNGLLLRADIDSLFDRGLISFSDGGEMLIKPELSRSDLEMVGLPLPISKKLTTKQCGYLARHRSAYRF